MAQLIDMIAVYELPASLTLSPGCFDKNFAIEISGLAGKATTPVIAWKEDNEPYMSAPRMEEGFKKYVEHYITNPERGWRRWHYWGNINSWNPKKHIALSPCVSALLLRFRINPDKLTYSNYLYGRGHPLGKEVSALFKEIDDWFERVRAWVEAATDQDISPGNPLSSIEMKGGGLKIFTIDKNTVSLPASASTIAVVRHKSEQVKLPTLRKIINQANMGVLPSDAHMLLRESRAARRRGQYRRAVIDAGSATEITLADFNRRVTRLSSRGGLPTLGWYVNQSAIASRARLPSNTRIGLVDIRNNAIHQNRTPTSDEVATALALAKRVVDTLDPLPL